MSFVISYTTSHFGGSTNILNCKDEMCNFVLKRFCFLGLLTVLQKILVLEIGDFVLQVILIREMDDFVLQVILMCQMGDFVLQLQVILMLEMGDFVLQNILELLLNRLQNTTTYIKLKIDVRAICCLCHGFYNKVTNKSTI